MSSETSKKVQKSLLNRNKGTLKKAIIALFLISTLTISVGFAKEAEEKAVFDKIYHVYNGEQYIGYVSDDELVAKVIEDKQKEANTKFKGYAIEAGEKISVIPEQIFNVQLKDEETVNKLRDVIEVEASGYALKIDGQVVTYLQNEQAYEEVLNLLKLQYVSQKELDVIAARPSIDELPILQENETRILEVSLEQEVVGEETKVSPSELKTIDEAVELLKNGTLKQDTYTVQQGDVLSKIAQQHHLTTAQLLKLNPDVTLTTILKIGQQLNVTVRKPLVTVKVLKETVQPQAVKYIKITEQDATMLKGESKLTQQGRDGKKQVTMVETLVNGDKTNTQTTEEVLVQEAINEITVVGTKVIPSRGTGTFVWPTNGGYISSHMGPRWGSQHRGIDIAQPSNYTIKAADNGVVTAAGWEGTYGYRIVIDHNNGFQTLYAHLSDIDVNVGQVVAQGSAIGVMGSTGNSTGTHLHFEVEKNGSLVNPLSYLR